jgi:hypothetical protein
MEGAPPHLQVSVFVTAWWVSHAGCVHPAARSTSNVQSAPTLEQLMTSEYHQLIDSFNPPRPFTHLMKANLLILLYTL